MGDIEALAAGRVFDQKPAQASQIGRPLLARFHSAYGKARARRYDRRGLNNARVHSEGQTAAPTAAGPSLAERVEGILLQTELAVQSIVRRVDHQAREIAAEADARLARDAIERHARLEELHRDLTERAVAISHGYEEIVRQLGAVEEALAAMTSPGGYGIGEVVGVRMKLRERTRISVAYDADSQAPPAPAAAVDSAPLEMHGRNQRLRWLRRSA
jgi:hypothetical protein